MECLTWQFYNYIYACNCETYGIAEVNSQVLIYSRKAWTNYFKVSHSIIYDSAKLKITEDKYGHR